MPPAPTPPPDVVERPLSFEDAMLALPESYSVAARNAGSPGAFALHDVRVAVDGRWGWAVGEYGTIIRLEGADDATRWVPDLEASALTRHALHGLDVSVDGRSGWAVGDAGTVLRLDDGRWRRDEVASLLMRDDLQAVTVDEDGAKGWAIARDPGPGSSRCTSVVLHEGDSALGPTCGSVDVSECELRHDGVDVWLRCIASCPEPDDPYPEGPHLWRFESDGWSLEAKCDEVAAAMPAPSTPRYASGWRVYGDAGRAGQIFKRGPERLEEQLHSSRGPIVVPGFEALPLAIEEEAQTLDDDSSAASYRLRLSVSHRVSRDRLEAVLEALGRQIMGETGSEPYAQLRVAVTFHPSVDDVAHWQHRKGKPGVFSTTLLGGTLEQRLRLVLVEGSVEHELGWWSGCPDSDESTVTVGAEGTRGTVVLSMIEGPYTGVPECALSIAHKALSRIEAIDSLKIRLEGSSGQPFLELSMRADDFLELDSVRAFGTRDHDLHHVDESGLSTRRRRQERRKIMDQWNRDVASKLAPHLLYYRGWDPR